MFTKGRGSFVSASITCPFTTVIFCAKPAVAKNIMRARLKNRPLVVGKFINPFFFNLVLLKVTPGK
jgi:hypothetical protein